MPFTVSHAAAVLPFRKLNLVWSAFIIGSMAPDFPYVIGNTDYRHIGHRFPGLLEFTIPASFLTLWLFHNIFKRPIVQLLPRGMQVRLREQLCPFPIAGTSRFIAILASIVLGIATHLIWDSFTHSDTWAFYHLPLLRGWVRLPFVGGMPVASALQYGSSAFGILALAAWIVLWYRRTPAPAEIRQTAIPSRFGLGVAMFAGAIAVGLVRAFAMIGMPVLHSNTHNFLLVFSVTALSLAFWQVVFYCVLVSSHQVWIIC